MEIDSKILLTYRDVTIRSSDLKCLNDKSWLNDICVSFYYEYLNQNEKLKLKKLMNFYIFK